MYNLLFQDITIIRLFKRINKSKNLNNFRIFMSKKNAISTLLPGILILQSLPHTLYIIYAKTYKANHLVTKIKKLSEERTNILLSSDNVKKGFKIFQELIED